nr:MAG TPA: hypothetical protein [Caudoviricetes sp.]
MNINIYSRFLSSSILLHFVLCPLEHGILMWISP